MAFLGRLNREEREANRDIIMDSDASKRDRITAGVDSYMGSSVGAGACLRSARHIPGGKWAARTAGEAFGGPAGAAGVQAGIMVDGHVEERAAEMREQRAERAMPVLSDIDSPSTDSIGDTSSHEADTYDVSH